MATRSPADPVTSLEVSALVVSIYDTAAALRRLGDAEAGVAGQTQARWQVMNVASEGVWTVPQIARRLGLQRQSVQRIVDLLRDDDLVDLRPNPDHATSSLVRLTDRGERVLREINSVADRWHHLVAGSADPSGLRTTAAFLRWLRAAADGSAVDDTS
jgi:DNA-binding MarR family transcriptional regulator